MKEKIKKILFPLVVKYRDLNKFWWHRFFLVIFAILIVATLLSVWIGLNKEEMDGYIACVGLSNYSEIASTKCGEIYKIHSSGNFLIGLAASLVVNYLIQIIYYKVILFIFLGEKLFEFRPRKFS